MLFRRKLLKILAIMAVILVMFAGGFGQTEQGQDALFRLGTGLAQGTDTTPPTIAAIFPAANATNVPVAIQLTLTFNEPIQATEFIVTYDNNVNIVIGRNGFEGNGTTTLTFIPQYPAILPCNRTFDVFVNNIRDLAGNPFQGVDNTGNGQTNDFSWRFQTGCVSNAGPDVSFSPATYNVAEGAGTVALTVSLNEESDETVSVDFETLDGSALAPSDYQARSGALTFAPGQTERRIEIAINDDQSIESAETFRVQLSNVTNGQLGANDTATVTIADNDTAIVVSFEPPSHEISEGHGTLILPVVLSRTSDELITVAYNTLPGSAAAASDFVAEDEVITFEPGVLTQRISIVIVDDLIQENTETFQVLLTSVDKPGVVLGVSTANVTILDDDEAEKPTVSFELATYDTNEANVTVRVTALLSQISTEPISVPVTTLDGTAIAPDDYVAWNGTLNIPAGVLSNSIDIQIQDDALPEVSETFSVNLGGPGSHATLGSISTTTVIIADNDNQFAVSLTPESAVVQSGGTVQFTAVVNGGIPPVSYSWNFGDGFVDNQTLVADATYTEPGEHSVTFRATDSTGRIADATSTVRVGNALVAGFTASQTTLILGEQVDFANTSTGTAPLTYAWDFGDGNGSDVESPSHAFGNTGTYLVTLQVTNEFGSSSASEEIFVRSNDSGNLNFDEFSTARSAVFWQPEGPNPTGFLTLSLVNLPDGYSRFDLIDALTFRVRIAGQQGTDTVSLTPEGHTSSFNERYDSDVSGLEIREVFINWVSDDEAMVHVAGQFDLPDVSIDTEPKEVTYGLLLPTNVVEGQGIGSNTNVTHVVRKNVWSFGE